jgi:hypothetical protein
MINVHLRHHDVDVARLPGRVSAVCRVALLNRVAQIPLMPRTAHPMWRNTRRRHSAKRALPAPAPHASFRDRGPTPDLEFGGYPHVDDFTTSLLVLPVNGGHPGIASVLAGSCRHPFWRHYAGHPANI